MEKRKLELYFDQPAKDFLESIPVGNGRLGAMIYGEVMREQVILNENTVWSGSRQNSDREDAYKYLPEIRRLLQENKNYEAEQVFAKHFTCQGIGSNYGHGADAQFGCYQILGRLMISYFQALSVGREGSYDIREYKRKLDLHTGICRVSFVTGGISFQREWVASRGQEALYLHLTSSEKNKISFSLGLDRDEAYEIEKINGTTLLMTGQLEDGKEGNQGIRYACGIQVIHQGGREKDCKNRIYIAEAEEATIIITARTNRKDFLNLEEIEEQKQCLEELQRAAAVSYETVREQTTSWYQEQADRTTLELGEGSRNESLPTPDRLKKILEGEEDDNFLALYVQYAKHLLICSSQEGGIPANLQGIWSEEIQTPWNGDWHLNAQQQIYWLAEKAGLSANHLPFLELTRLLTEPGSRTAANYYQAAGWVVHTMTNPWGFTSPMEETSWGSTLGSAAWQCQHIFDHYLYTEDQQFLNQYYPVMKGAAQFYMDLLVEDQEKGYLVTSPSSSPENIFLDEEGRHCALCKGPAYDRQLVSELIDDCIQAQYILKNDKKFLEKLIRIRERLAPTEITNDGKIMEWDREYEEALPFHRHLAQLWGVYPGNRISREKTPELAKAAEKSLMARGTTTAGWACAYRLCVADRLREGEEAYAYLMDAFRTATAPNLMNLAFHCNEASLHHEEPRIGQVKYQFQMDGNEANATGILLMLVDDEMTISEEGRSEIHIYLLPALSRKLPRGKAENISVRGGMTVSLEWKKGELETAMVKGKPNTEFILHYREITKKAETDEKGEYVFGVVDKISSYA